jgi:predicted dehydrogenase
MRELGVGIVGCGVISTIYMRNMAMFAGVVLRACADVRLEAAAAQGSAFGIPALEVEALLRRDDIDVVVNLTVPNAHFTISQAALSAGKHVFTEKPLTVSVQQGRALVQEADARGLFLGCAPDTFLGAGGRLARRMVDDGQVGRILAGSAFLASHGMEHWHPDPEFFYKPGGGPILDVGPYYISALVNLLGPVARVQAQATTGFAERVVTAKGPREGHRIAVETPTTVLALLEFAAGARIALTMSWDVWKHGHPAIELYGTEGSLRVPDPNFFGGVVGFTERDGDWQDASSADMPYGRANWRSPAWPATRPAQANFRCLGLAELASAVISGTPHRSSGRVALHALEVMYGILEAGETRRTVEIETQIERPAALADAAARALARPGAEI